MSIFILNCGQCLTSLVPKFCSKKNFDNCLKQAKTFFRSFLFHPLISFKFIQIDKHRLHWLF